MRETRDRWSWRDHLTAEEAEAVNRAELAKAEWQRLRMERVVIQNRAIQRAKYVAGRAALSQPQEAEHGE